MHRSRFSTICIDVPADLRDAAEAFWSSALERPATRFERHPEYSTLGDVNGHRILVQAIGDGVARVHLDVHTDNGPAETARLVALGATVIDDSLGWTVLKDPGGTLFCVVPCEPGDPSLEGASEWP